MKDGYLTAYWLDRKNVITRVSLFWDEFALENDGGKAVSSKVCGKSMWEFVGDETTKAWLEMLFENTRRKGIPVERPYRCDAPSEKRHMIMKITPDPSGNLFVEHYLTHVEPRRTPVFFMRSEAAKSDHKKFLRCSNCGRIKINTDWIEAESAIGISNLMVSYTICDACR